MIKALIDQRVKAVRAKDVDASVSAYARDLLLFDVVNPLRSAGSASAGARASEWFSSFEGPIGFRMCELTISAGEDVAFSYSLNQVNAKKLDGGTLEMWWRATVCYCKIGGEWKVTHEHNSVPFDVQTGKAALDLKP